MKKKISVLYCVGFEYFLIRTITKIYRTTREDIFNPLLPSVPYMTRSTKFFFFNLTYGGIIKKFPMTVATMSR